MVQREIRYVRREERIRDEKREGNRRERERVGEAI